MTMLAPSRSVLGAFVRSPLGVRLERSVFVPAVIVSASISGFTRKRASINPALPYVSPPNQTEFSAYLAAQYGGPIVGRHVYWDIWPFFQGHVFGADESMDISSILNDNMAAYMPDDHVSASTSIPTNTFTFRIAQTVEIRMTLLQFYYWPGYPTEGFLLVNGYVIRSFDVTLRLSARPSARVKVEVTISSGKASAGSGHSSGVFTASPSGQIDVVTTVTTGLQEDALPVSDMTNAGYGSKTPGSVITRWYYLRRTFKPGSSSVPVTPDQMGYSYEGDPAVSNSERSTAGGASFDAVYSIAARMSYQS